jgi:hypothetical protein
MADSPDLRLNDLARFRKTSTRLALEVHSHCEVPAGCGGVVLRWRRPDAPIGLSISKYFGGQVDAMFLDGKPVAEQRITVSPGEHVLSFVVENPGKEGFILLQASLAPEIATALRSHAISCADGHWRASRRLPPDDWQLPGFDAADFVALVEAPVPTPTGNESWLWKHLGEQAKGLGFPASASDAAGGWLQRMFTRPPDRAWVRWTFRVDHQGFA